MSISQRTEKYSDPIFFLKLSIHPDPFFLRGLRRVGIFTITTYLFAIGGPKAPLSPLMILGDMKLLNLDIPPQPNAPPFRGFRLRLRYAALAARAFLVCFNLAIYYSHFISLSRNAP